MININGVAHVMLNVTRWGECCDFYCSLLPFLGMKKVFEGEETIYFVGGRTGIGINKVENNDEMFDQKKVGLHHLCFRARKIEDVDSLFKFLQDNGDKIIHPPKKGAWAPGYYSMLFEDPIGTRLEVNYVPGEGVLAEDARFNPAGDYR